MNKLNLPEPILITSNTALHRMAQILAQQTIIAVDTESNSLYAYRERVCLIQFSTTERDYLVDPLTIDDLSPLSNIFANKDIEKIFHAAEYDLMLLQREFNFTFANLFDTMIAARTLGKDALGLGSLIKDEFGVAVDKRFQRANWGKRPLNRDMLRYAQLDTHFLIPLRHRQYRELKDSGLLPLAQEDFQRACHVHMPDEKSSLEKCWRLNGSHDLTPQQAAVLLCLCKFRETVAKNRNQPLFRIINDKTLLAIAHQCPHTLEQLQDIPGMSKYLLKEYGNKVLKCVADGLADEPLYPPQHKRPSDEYLARLDRLKRWRKLKARNMGVGSEVILPRDLLQDIVNQNPATSSQLATIMHSTPWRFAKFGDEILHTLDGR